MDDNFSFFAARTRTRAHTHTHTESRCQATFHISSPERGCISTRTFRDSAALFASFISILKTSKKLSLWSNSSFNKRRKDQHNRSNGTRRELYILEIISKYRYFIPPFAPRPLSQLINIQTLDCCSMCRFKELELS